MPYQSSLQGSQENKANKKDDYKNNCPFLMQLKFSTVFGNAGK